MSNPYKTKQPKPMAPSLKPKPKGAELRQQSELPMPSQATIDANSTKGTMGEGKVNVLGIIAKGAIKAATKMGESVKNMVNQSMDRTTQVREDNMGRAKQIEEARKMAPNFRKKK